MRLDPLTSLQVLLFTTSCWCGWLRGRALASGRYHPLNVITVVHSWFSAASVMMQWLWGVPNYEVFLHLRAVNDSHVTWIVYYMFSSILCLVFAGTAQYSDRTPTVKPTSNRARTRYNTGVRDRILLWIGLVSPVLCALFSPDSRIWTQYAVLLDLQPNAEFATFVNVLYWTTYIAILSSCGLLLAAQTGVAQAVPIGIFTFAALWFNGKRNIVILALVLVVLSLRIRGGISRRTTYASFAVALVFFLGYSQWYQAEYRPFLSSFDTYYEMARMDFTRDADIRIALYAELEEAANPILEYRGQSLLFDTLFFIPRTMWEEKPKPYYFYITSTALDGPRIYRTWGITTTILSEAIANVGLAGLLLGPLFLIMIAVIGYRPENPFLNMFTCIICTLFMSIHLAGFTVLWSAWCVFIFSSLWSRTHARVTRWAEVH